MDFCRNPRRTSDKVCLDNGAPAGSRRSPPCAHRGLLRRWFPQSHGVRPVSRPLLLVSPSGMVPGGSGDQMPAPYDSRRISRFAPKQWSVAWHASR
jgi:hypothetical protein